MTNQPLGDGRSGFDVTNIDARHYNNTSEEVFSTTVNKARVCLYKHQKILKGRISWIAPFGVFVTSLAAATSTKDYINVFGIEGKYWGAALMITVGVSAIWLLVSLFLTYRAWRKGGIEELVDNLVGGKADERNEE